MLSAAAVLLVILQCGKTKHSNNEIQQGVESLRRQLIRDNYDYMYDDINSHISMNTNGGGEEKNPTGKSEIKEQNTKIDDSRGKRHEISIAKARLERKENIDKSIHKPKSDTKTIGGRENRNEISISNTRLERRKIEANNRKNISKTYDGKTSKVLFVDVDQTKEKKQHIGNRKESLKLNRRTIPQSKKGKSKQVIRVEDSNRILRKKKHNVGNNTKENNQNVVNSKKSLNLNTSSLQYTQQVSKRVIRVDGDRNLREKNDGYNTEETNQSVGNNEDTYFNLTRRSQQVNDCNRSLIKKKRNGNNTIRKNQSVVHSKESFRTESLKSVIRIEDGNGNSREKKHNIKESEESKPYIHKDSKPDKTRRSNRVVEVEDDRGLKENKTEDDIFDKHAISNKYLATSKYTILREKNPSRRKDAQTLVQEEAIDGVVIASLDEGPVPPLRLPPERRQYMEAYGAVISEDEEVAPPPY